MSSEAIQNCQRAQDNIKKHELKDYQKVFPSIENGLEKTRSFYLDWLEIHREYAYGFQQLQMGYVAKSSATRLVSQWVNTELTSFTNIVDARIPVEAYLLVSAFYNLFGRNKTFVLEEGYQFESIDLKDELQSELAKLTPPRNQSQVKAIITKLIGNEIRKISYESNERSSTHAWLVLLHKVGHDLYDTESLYTLSPEPRESSTKEILIDLLIGYIFGPAYALALANYHQKYPLGTGKTHPKEPERLYALLKSSQDMNNKCKALGLSFSSKIDFCYRKLVEVWLPKKDEFREDQERIDKIFDKIKDGILNYLSKKQIDSFDKFLTKYDDKIGAYEPGLDKILDLVKLKIPLAIDPRILFNSLVDQEEITPLLLSESLKRWVVQSTWKSLSTESS